MVQPPSLPPENPPACLRCHKIMTLTNISAHSTIPNVDVMEFDCVCGYLTALPVPRKV